MENPVFENLGSLDDKNAAVIVEAADRGTILSGGSYRNVVREARELVNTARGHWVYIGSIGNSPQLREPSDE